MGFFIALFLIPAVLLVILMLAKIVIYLLMTHNFRILLWGFIFGLAGIFIFLAECKRKGEIYPPFEIMFFLTVFIILPSIAAFVLGFIPVAVIRKISNIMSSGVVTMFVFFMLNAIFIDTISVFQLLGIQVSR